MKKLLRCIFTQGLYDLEAFLAPMDYPQIGPVRRSVVIFSCRLKKRLKNTNKYQTDAGDYNGPDDHVASMW